MQKRFKVLSDITCKSKNLYRGEIECGIDTLIDELKAVKRNANIAGPNAEQALNGKIASVESLTKEYERCVKTLNSLLVCSRKRVSKIKKQVNKARVGLSNKEETVLTNIERMRSKLARR